MEKKLDFTKEAREQIDKITQGEEKNILESLLKVADAQALNIVLDLKISQIMMIFYSIK